MDYFIKKAALLVCFSAWIYMEACKNHVSSDRYLTMKIKPSDQLRMENQEVTEKGNKAYKKQLEKNKEAIKDNNKKALKMKKRYHVRHLRKRRKSKN